MSIHPIAGAYQGTTQAKIKKNGAEDFVLFQFNEAALTAATFTQNAFCAAPVNVAKVNLAKKSPRALVINSGNANAGTGEQGFEDAIQTCQWVSEEIGCDPLEVLPFSTGVIGENLPMDKIQTAIPMAAANLTVTGWEAAAKGIMTTDTIEKIYSKQFEIEGNPVTITGISKGSGMIHPNMATMLGFVVTDAKINQACLQQALTDAVNISFNRITVDGDTSTNDACTLTATQQAEMDEITSTESFAYQQFANAVNHCMIELAQAIIKDGEGATKFVTIEVEDAANCAEAHQVANTVALSPLVKTALFASDPNWGRILAAVGRAGIENFNINTIEIYLGDVLLVEKGGRAASYTESAGQDVMDQPEITIRIVLNRGDAAEMVWTTDFSYDYVKINAEYRT